jgi:hypothetical protein
MKVKDFLIVAGFILLFTVIIVLFVGQEMQPVDSKALTQELKTVQSLNTEAQALLSDNHKANTIYAKAYLEDISKEVEDIQKDLEDKKYEKGLNTRRGEIIGLCQRIINNIDAASRSLEQSKIKSTVVDLKAIYESMDSIIQQI